MRLFFVVLLCVVLASCTTVAPKVDPGKLRDLHQKKIQQLSSWRVEGQISISDGKESGVLNLIWTNEATAYQLKLMTPFGSPVFSLDADPSGVVLYLPNQPALSSSNVDYLVEHYSGMEVPVTALKKWINGLDQTSQAKFGADGLLASSFMQGWSLQIESYSLQNHKTLGDIAMPKVLRLAKNDLRLKLRVASWNINSTRSVVRFDDEAPPLPLFGH